MGYPIITLWELTSPQGTTIRLTSSNPVRPDQTPFPDKMIVIGGERYYCTGIAASGVERTVGSVPTIRLEARLTEYLRARKDIVFVRGTCVMRFITDARAADKVNWADDSNPYTSDGEPARVNHRTDSWIITRISEETQYDLSAEMQNEQAFWNSIVRPDLRGRCYHKYRGDACGYSGTNYWDVNNNPVSTAAEDVCALSIKACELRFPTGSLPYGGLPQEEDL